MQEVTGTDQAAAGAGGDLLNAFNVATFKNDEDDTAFWNRLIPSTDRAAKEEAPQELGIRAARLKTYDEVGAYLRHKSQVSQGGYGFSGRSGGCCLTGRNPVQPLSPLHAQSV